MSTAQLEDDTFQQVTQFIEVIKQQKLSPTILQFSTQLFKNIHDRLKLQEDNIRIYLKNTEQQSMTDIQTKNFMHLVYDAQVQKIKYLLKLYLRIRLVKIQKFCFHILKNSKLDSFLSAEERQFHKKYCQLKYSYLKNNVLKMFPQPYQDFGGVEVKYGNPKEEKPLVDTKQSKIDHIQPNLQSYCFVKILKNPKNLRFNLDIKVSNMHQKETEVISQQEIIFGPYKQVSKLIEGRDAKFI